MFVYYIDVCLHPFSTYGIDLYLEASSHAQKYESSVVGEKLDTVCLSVLQ